MSRRAIVAVVFLAACTSPNPTGPGSDPDLGSASNGGGFDLAHLPGADLAGTPSDDGTPMQGACVSQFGSAMSNSYGRLDGYVWSVVAIGNHGCSGDSSHIHLQVKMKGAVYNIAITAVDPQTVDFLEKDVSQIGMPATWAEGWHTGASLDYVALGLHAADFAPTPSATIESTLKSALAKANHISVFTTGFGPDGGHLVHRNGNGRDGAILIDPLSSTPHAFFFHFANQSF